MIFLILFGELTFLSCFDTVEGTSGLLKLWPFIAKLVG